MTRAQRIIIEAATNYPEPTVKKTRPRSVIYSVPKVQMPTSGSSQGSSDSAASKTMKAVSKVASSFARKGNRSLGKSTSKAMKSLQPFGQPTTRVQQYDR